MHASKETHVGADSDGTRRRLRLIVVAVPAAVLIGAAGFLAHLATRSSQDVAAAPVPAGPALDPPQAAQALVFVSGAVAQPGLYVLPATARVSDALAAAGGITADADSGHLPDLAERVHDGKQVNIPFRRTGGGSGGAGTTATRFANRLDVNTATLDQLRAVPGMPLGLPEAILDARQTFGPFQSMSQLKTILGLDGPTYTAVRVYLRAGQSVK
jgi:competence protein ComEA